MPPITGSTGSRLVHCRRLHHGLARSPVVKTAVPRGDRALLACPKNGEGTCAYRRTYGCDDAVRELGLARGDCEVELRNFTALHAAVLAILRYGDGVDPGPVVATAVTAFCEAATYEDRAAAYIGLRMTGEVEKPSHKDLSRYQEAGMNAAHRRLEEAARARAVELRFDLDDILESACGRAWLWFMEVRKHPWLINWTRRVASPKGPDSGR